MIGPTTASICAPTVTTRPAESALSKALGHLRVE
jgi:hypothetical protein